MSQKTNLTVKKCIGCKANLSINDYCIDRQTKSGLHPYCRLCRKIRRAEQYKKHRDRELRTSSAWAKKRKIYMKNHNATKTKEFLTRIYTKLGSKCSSCYFSDKRALQIDHVNGGGNIERRFLGNSTQYYLHVIKSIENGSKNYQILCANCNIIQACEKGYKKSIWH